VSSAIAAGGAPWFHIRTGTLTMRALPWRTQLHSEICGYPADFDVFPSPAG